MKPAIAKASSRSSQPSSPRRISDLEMSLSSCDKNMTVFPVGRKKIGTSKLWLWSIAAALAISSCHALSLSSYSSFHGGKLQNNAPFSSRINKRQQSTTGRNNIQGGYSIGVADSYGGFGSWTMRKQKSSDKRTRRMQQRNGDELTQDLIIQSLQQQSQSLPTTLTSFPTPNGLTPQQRKRDLGHPFVYPHQHKEAQEISNSNNNNQFSHLKTGGRGRSRKRAALYNTLSSYHNKYLDLLTKEYQYEVRYNILV